MDLVFIVLIAIFFAAAVAYVNLCDKLSNSDE